MAHYSKEQRTKSGILYWVFSEKKIQPLILIPGFTGTHNDVSELANILKEKYTVIVPEFPGWENAAMEKSSYTVHSYASLIKNLIEDLELSNVPIVAHCMGATVALEAAYNFPKNIREVILMSVPYQDGTIGKTFFLTLSAMSKKAPPFFRPLFFFWRSRIITTPISFFVLKTKTMSKKRTLIRRVFFKQSRQNEHVLETNWNSLIRYDYTKLSHLTIPVHILHGEEDLLISPLQAKRLAEIIPHATCDMVPRAGHLPPVETPETVAKIIEKYL